MIFLSYLWINVGNKSHSISRTGDSLSGATVYACINTVYKFIKYFLDNKMSIFEGYGAFK